MTTEAEKAKHAAYMREWLYKNKVRVNTNRRKRYADDIEHREKLLDACKVYREKDIAAYHVQQKNKYDKHGHKYRKRIKAQYDVDSTVVLARNKQWRNSHPEKVSADKLAWARKFKAEHPEEYKARCKAVYERRKDKVVVYGKRWRKENAGKHAANSAERCTMTPCSANFFSHSA